MKLVEGPKAWSEQADLADKLKWHESWVKKQRQKRNHVRALGRMKSVSEAYVCCVMDDN